MGRGGEGFEGIRAFFFFSRSVLFCGGRQRPGSVAVVSGVVCYGSGYSGHGDTLV